MGTIQLWEKYMAELYYDKLHKNIYHTIRMGYIYTITNKTDNKTYVGQTVRELDTRWKDHLKKRSNCRYLKSAINKYGVENFVFNLVCITFDNMLDDMEIQYIQKYNCLVPNGYNLRLGGNSGRHNAETKQKISESLKLRYKNGLTPPSSHLGKPHSEIHKKKISECLNGHRLSQETINKISLSRRKNKIIQFDIDGNRLNSFNTCKEAAEYIGTTRANINHSCSGKHKTAKGFVWKYEPIVK
jgi:group I intron endonuclease